MENVSKCYAVKHIGKEKLNITGKGTDDLWERADSLTDFNSPWDSEKIKKIKFKALWDSEKIFFLFKVDDPEVHIDSAENTLDSINNSDRVELFFRINKELDPYYCLEIDPNSRIMDFKARPNKQFDFSWNWPAKDIEVKSSIESECFTVEIAISLSSLTQLGLIKDGKIEAGIYRAKYNKQASGNYEPTWITWVDPCTEDPNFHIVSSFGVLKLENFNSR